MPSSNSLTYIGARPLRLVAERALGVMTAVHDGADAAAIAAILNRYGENAQESLSRRDFAELATVGQELWRIVHLGSVDEWAAAVNALLARWAGPPRLVHEGVGWHVHVDRDNEASWAEWFASSTGFAFAVLLAEHDEPPVALCADETCSQPFLRAGRGKPRHFCSSRCATRARVREHRQRHASKQA